MSSKYVFPYFAANEVERSPVDYTQLLSIPIQLAKTSHTCGVTYGVTYGVNNTIFSGCNECIENDGSLKLFGKGGDCPSQEQQLPSVKLGENVALERHCVSNDFFTSLFFLLCS